MGSERRGEVWTQYIVCEVGLQLKRRALTKTKPITLLLLSPHMGQIMI